MDQLAYSNSISSVKARARWRRRSRAVRHFPLREEATLLPLLKSIASRMTFLISPREAALSSSSLKGKNCQRSLHWKLGRRTEASRLNNAADTWVRHDGQR